MAKRKYVGSATTIPPSKRAKLEASTRAIRATSPILPVSPPATFTRPEKRKRTQYSQIGLESPESSTRSKRARTSNSPDNLTESPPGSSPVAWPSLEWPEAPSEDELDDLAREFIESYNKASGQESNSPSNSPDNLTESPPGSSPAAWPSLEWPEAPSEDELDDQAREYRDAFREACFKAATMGAGGLSPVEGPNLVEADASGQDGLYGHRRHTPYQSPLPSPTSPVRDTIEDDTVESLESWGTRTPPPGLPETSPPRRYHGARRFRRTPTPLPERLPHRKRREKKQKKGGKDGHGPSQDWKSSPVVQEFLGSRRSSRRNAECELWYLGDDGKAYIR